MTFILSSPHLDFMVTFIYYHFWGMLLYPFLLLFLIITFANLSWIVIAKLVCLFCFSSVSARTQDGFSLEIEEWVGGVVCVCVCVCVCEGVASVRHG